MRERAGAPTRRRRTWWSAAAACSLLLLNATFARASTFPGANGVIAYSDFSTGSDHAFHIWVVDPDGGGRRQLTSTPLVLDGHPHFSPDGSLIVFNRMPDYGGPGVPTPAADPPQTWIMNADGSAQRPIGPPSSQVSAPSFTADGRHIVFQVSGSGFEAPDYIWEMNLDGSGAHQLIGAAGTSPSASPDGTRLLFSGGIASADGSSVHPAPFGCTDNWSPDSRLLVCPGANGSGVRVVAANGGGQPRTVAPDLGFQTESAFSPDGTHIAFKTQIEPTSVPQRSLYTVGVDGAELTRIIPYADAPGQAPEEPDWQPIPLPPATSATIVAASTSTGDALRHLRASHPAVTVGFTARTAGTAGVRVTRTTGVAKKAQLAAIRSVIVARGTRKILRSGRTTITVRLTRAGEKLLASAHRRHQTLTLTSLITFAPHRGTATSRAASVTIKP